ncbi:hypothetical protein [Sphingomonas sp. Y38-1Y]|uniref:hypothetical protein n=1 Tax=Sphingomonas sp. Y38-1Y TaxID=3078265 RepID=UPI0028F0BB83|nr:hypothetical protein [Sphingomonas sp. Y38-1Y]
MIPALGAAAIVGALPASAQIDPVATGQGAVLSTTMRAHSSRSGRAASRAETSAKARSTCAQRASIRARFGADDPRVKQMYALCDRLGY